MEEKDLKDVTKIKKLKEFVDVFSEIVNCKKLLRYNYTEYADTSLSGMSYGRTLSVIFEDESGVEQQYRSALYETYYTGDVMLNTLDTINSSITGLIYIDYIKTPDKEDIRKSKNPDKMKNFKLDRGLM